MTFFIQLGFVILMLGIIFVALLGLINFIPTTVIEVALENARPYWGTADTLFPMTTIFASVTALVVLELTLLGYTVLKWVWSKIPGVR